MRLAVAATAPLGADVLERLAAKHEIAYLLTRPDRPRGRGRKLAPPPAKETAERLGIEVRQPERLDDFDPEVDTVVVAAYGVLIPETVLDRALWLNVHPSLLPRWRGAAPIERALMAGDEETGVTIIELVPELDAGPIAAQQAFPIGPEDDFGTVSARAAELAAELLEEALPEPTLRPQPDEGVTYAEKIRPEDRELDWSRPPQELLNRIRALSPHIGARGELHGRPVTIWRARVEGGELVPVEVQPDGGQAHGLRRVPARRCDPTRAVVARRAGAAVSRVVRPRLRGRRLRRPRLSRRGRGARPARPGAGAAARVRDRPARPHARPRDRGARRAAGRASSTRRCARRCGSARTSSRYSEVAAHAAVNESVELVRAAGLERAVKFTNAVMRRLALGLRELVEALPEATPEEAALRHSYPDWVARGLVARPRRRGGASS